MPTVAIINDNVDPPVVGNISTIGSLEPNYGLHLCWIDNGWGIGDIWLGTDPDTGMGIFKHPDEE